MTKTEKQNIEASKPIKEQNYWKLSKESKKTWLEHHNMDFKIDILFPIIELGILFLMFIFCIIGFAIARGGALAIIIFIFIFYLALATWCIYRMIKNNRGLFIARFWHIEKAHKEQNKNTSKTNNQEEIKFKKSSDDSDLELI